MKITGLDHIGIAVSDLDAALAVYRDALGIAVDHAEEVPTEGVRTAFLPVGDTRLEGQSLIPNSSSHW